MSNNNEDRLYPKIREEVKLVGVLAVSLIVTFVLVSLCLAFNFSNLAYFVVGVFASLWGFVNGRSLKNKSHDEQLRSAAHNIATLEIEIKSLQKELDEAKTLKTVEEVKIPAEVKEALKAAKTKGKPTKLPPKRKPKTIPPAQA